MFGLVQVFTGMGFCEMYHYASPIANRFEQKNRSEHRCQGSKASRGECGLVQPNDWASRFMRVDSH